MNAKDYLCWLMNEGQIEAEGPEGYLHLCEALQGIYFVSLVEFDENRVEEGKELREEWADSFCGDISALEGELIPYTCTALEMIIVMARRMYFEMSDSQYEAGIGKWVTELLENAGLAYWRNDIFETDPEYSQNRIRATVNSIIYRRYLYNGEGSFFPVSYSRTDVRKQELLVQMNNYLAENYDIC